MAVRRLAGGESRKKEFFFCKNEARKLLKTNYHVSKKNRNEPKTKLAKLLKIRNGHKNEAKPNRQRSQPSY